MTDTRPEKPPERPAEHRAWCPECDHYADQHLPGCPRVSPAKHGADDLPRIVERKHPWRSLAAEVLRRAADLLER